MRLPKLNFKINLPELKTEINLPKLQSPFFPHFSRSIPVAYLRQPLTYFFWALIFSVSFLNLIHSRLFGFTEANALRYSLLENPYNQALHIKLGNLYLLQGDKNIAKQEFDLAQNFYSKNKTLSASNVLGTSTSPQQLWNDIKNKNMTLQEETNFWLDLSYNFPDYYYAYLKLAVNYMKVGQKDKAQLYINKILSLDPNNSLALKLNSLNK